MCATGAEDTCERGDTEDTCERSEGTFRRNSPTSNTPSVAGTEILAGDSATGATGAEASVGASESSSDVSFIVRS